ncbi:hypothetical protein [Clostridium estertheticum]|uniref:Uncharacterized protein n=1 Tax=Clostridium estertheticum TaxID=238834 RepID=A0AA47I4L5_9CLOT|nr:hypothetical protein [Clostridium estertheticum]MBU3157916.1 hypothetical protein [Clostridium estertheticum]WAG59392.1 hypothetical protein LL038_17355 [Clostridium estertheticum]
MLGLINIISIIIVIVLVITSRKCLEIVRVGTISKNLYYKEIHLYILISSLLLITGVILSGVTFFRMLTVFNCSYLSGYIEIFF